MPRQILEVFLSSTGKDLEAFRKAVHARLIRSGQFHCVWQEDFGPQSATAIDVCRTKVETADLFVGLVGLRRGWEPTGDAAHRSIAEMEHDWAVAAGKRRYVWVTPDDFPFPGNLRESDAEHARQQAFRTRLMAGGALVVSQSGFGSPEMLAADVTEHLLRAEIVAELQKRGTVATAERAGLEGEIIAKLAQRLKPGETLDFELSVKELENAVGIALDSIARGQRGTNEDIFVNTVLERVAERTKAGQFDQATQEVDAALVELDRTETAQRDALRRSRIALLEAGIQQDILRRDALAVARRVDRIAATEEPDDSAQRFEVLRRRQDIFHVEGRDKGLNFSLEIAIGVARLTINCAQNPDQHGTSLNDLGVSLWTLGERESGTARLEEAVTAYRDALKERTRERVPLDWATTQNNLGSALGSLGARESGTARLEEAVAAFRDALKEYTRERGPLQWATTQNNLGNALQTLGARASGTARLEEAVAAHRDALKERTRERVPLDWAMTQNNLGTALATLGARESGTARLEEAVAAFRAGIEVFEHSGASHYLAVAQRNLARAEADIASRRSNGSD